MGGIVAVFAIFASVMTMKIRYQNEREIESRERKAI